MATTIPEVIKIRTQQEGQGTSGSLEKLAPSTVKYRERYSDNLGDTSPGKSNLTATGQLIDSITGKPTGDKVTISLKGKRKRELSGSKSSLTNDQVGAYVKENGREFLKLSAQEKEEATDLAAQIITDEIREALK